MTELIKKEPTMNYCRCRTCNKWVAEQNLYPFKNCKSCFDETKPKIQDLENKF